MSDKSKRSFLISLCRQLRAALDDGEELAYEFAELVDEALDLITAPSSDPELGDAESGGDGEGDDAAGGHDEVHQEGVLRDPPDLGGGVRSERGAATDVDVCVACGAPAVAGATPGDAGRAARMMQLAFGGLGLGGKVKRGALATQQRS